MEVIVMKELLGENAKEAEKNRSFFADRHILPVNLMGSPGSGKTTLIAALSKELKKSGIPVGVIEGDLFSTIDAEKFAGKGIPVSQINTRGECHLDAAVIREGAEKLDFSDGVVFIENVGNLICPAEFDLGESLRLIAASVPEGDDKPYKYIPMYSYVDAVVLTKCDLKEAVGFDTDYFKKGVALLGDAPVFEVSLNAKEQSGAQAVADFLKERLEEKKA